MNEKIKEGVTDVAGLSLTTAALQQELLAKEGLQCWSQQRFGEDGTIRVCAGQDSLWVLLRRPGKGGFALRTAYSPGAALQVQATSKGETAGTTTYEVQAAAGKFRVEIRIEGDTQNPVLRCTTRLTPSQELLLPFWPRDLYPLGGQTESDPSAAEGEIMAAQRGLNVGLVYLTMKEPAFGTLLYLQNLTALNEYFLLTDTKPDGVVGGDWPEMGYLMPVSPTKPLPAGKEVVISDVALAYKADKLPKDVREDAQQFLDLLAAVYRTIDRPETEYHDWPRLAERSLRDLEKSPKATITHYGHRYLRPYTDFEYPDSMVQLTVLTPILEYGSWKQKEMPFADELRSGVNRFYDKKLGTIRRYLPNVGDDKDADAVDSWYLYHPLINLGRLAKEYDDKEARELFLNGLEFGIKAARHFKYEWPIQYNIETLDVIKEERNETGLGQSDVGGIYAYAMIQAWELTEEKRYLDEAIKAIDVLKEMGFELEYQANTTCWGANACMRLWRITGNDFYRDQSFIFLANLFHNSVIWESQIKNAEHYRVFLGETCLHDAPYMAIYECYESYASIHEYLGVGGDDLPDSVVQMLTEFAKYTLTRAWYYYPEHLPKEILATEIRNNEIDRTLAFPLEDVYADGQPAGQVGQEVYGSGASFTFVSRAYRRLEEVPFIVYTEYPMADFTIGTDIDSAGESQDQSCFQFRLRGAEGFTSRVRLIPKGRKELPKISVAPVEEAAKREALPLASRDKGEIEFYAPANKPLCIYWS